MASNGISAVPKGGQNSTSEGLRMVVAIDFGTTYSSIAYANTFEPDKQKVLTSWGRGCPTDDRVPTILRYDNGGSTGAFKWGFQAQQQLSRGQKIHEWFKLQLCPEYEGRRAAESELSRKYPSRTALEPVRGEDAEKLVVDFLSRLKERVEENFNALDESVRKIPREYVVTVPAIWNDMEQNKTRICAERAELGSGNCLRLVSEPEAAAIYALESMSRLGLTVGDTFVICDAGGGTVDLTSYKIQSLSPILLEGAGRGSGGLCGSSFLNRIFEKYLGDKLRGYCGGWSEGWLNHALAEFETKIKPRYTGDDHEVHTIMVHGLSDSPQHGIINHTLEMSGKELRTKVFDEVITKIQGLVRDQIVSTSGPVKAVLLCGGFGQNAYLREQLQQLPSVKEQGIEVQQIDNSNTAIVRGALIAGLTRRDKAQEGVFRVPGPRVLSRIAGRSYGTRASQPFNPSEDDEWRKDIQPTGEYLVERMQWLINEGDTIVDQDPQSFRYHREQVTTLGPIKEVKIRIYSSEKKGTDNTDLPKYPDDPAVRECANFTMDISHLTVPTEIHKGKVFYVAKIDIEMVLESASLKFCGIYGKGTDSEKRFEPQLVTFM